MHTHGPELFDAGTAGVGEEVGVLLRQLAPNGVSAADSGDAVGDPRASVREKEGAVAVEELVPKVGRHST
jgi:hypothetical protein